MTKALEVAIDGNIVGVYVPAPGNVFVATLGKQSETQMLATVRSGSDQEWWHWEIPNIEEGQNISFKIIETSEKGVPPQTVEPK